MKLIFLIVSILLFLLAFMGVQLFGQLNLVALGLAALAASFLPVP